MRERKKVTPLGSIFKKSSHNSKDPDREREEKIIEGTRDLKNKEEKDQQTPLLDQNTLLAFSN